MKLVGRAVDAFLKRPDPTARAVLLFGPDSGLVRERADSLSKAVVPDLSDPFRVVDVSGRNLIDDPARLADEVSALSLTGGRRLVRVRDAEDTLAPIMVRFFAAPAPGDTLIVAEAGDLPTRSKLRAAFEAADIGAAIPCYVETDAALSSVIADRLRQAGYSGEADAIAFLAERLVGDRRVALSEIDKLVLYAGVNRTISLADAEACIGDSATLEPDEPVLCAADGDFAGLDRSLGRLFADGAAAVQLLRGAQRHFQRLLIIAAETSQGGNPAAVVERLKPPVFFKLKPRLTAQARVWSLPRVRQALERLVDAEAEVKRTGIPDQTVCSRALFQIASIAARR